MFATIDSGSILAQKDTFRDTPVKIWGIWLIMTKISREKSYFIKKAMELDERLCDSFNNQRTRNPKVKNLWKTFNVFLNNHP